MPHTQKSAAERAQAIAISQGGLYAKSQWVAASPAPAKVGGK